MSAESEHVYRTWLGVAVWLAAVLLVFGKPLVALARLALSNENASHTLLIPLIAAWLLYVERKQIFSRPVRDLAVGILFLAGAIGVAAWAFYSGTQFFSPDALTYYILAFVLACLAGFAFAFGRHTLRSGTFPFSFLLLLAPWPSFVLDPVISYLQRGSAEIAGAIFDLSRVPVLREGLVFHLSRVSIEVAPECSGIRSSMALLVLALLISHFAFRPFWKKALFVSAGIVMMIVKNGVRIATLTLLANYVDPGFLYGNLHRQGGIVFFLIGLALMLPVYWLLKRDEGSVEAAGGAPRLRRQGELL